MDPIHIISLGAGVQSSTMALMAACGEITPMPVAAIFADTQAEPKSVYTWLDWLEKQLPFPVYRVTHKRGLWVESLELRNRKDGQGQWQKSGIPHFTINTNGTLGMGPRQCTQDFKIDPIRRKAKLIANIKGRVKTIRVVQWIGISVDEAQRMKDSRDAWCKNRWPLIDLRMRRQDCLRWMSDHAFPTPPRSACVFCPFHSDTEWRRLKTQEPEEFRRAVEFERLYATGKQKILKESGPLRFFVHASRKPLSEVDFSTEEERGQLSMFNNECEGMCGV